jgi:hypothetical protein
MPCKCTRKQYISINKNGQPMLPVFLCPIVRFDDQIASHPGSLDLPRAAVERVENEGKKWSPSLSLRPHTTSRYLEYKGLQT